MNARIGLVCLAALSLLACHDRERATDADGQLVIFPGDLDFARVPLYGKSELEVSLKNVGRGRLGVEKMWAEGPDGTTYEAEFTHEGPHSLVPGGDCTIRIRFSPLAEGKLTGFLAVKTDSLGFPVVRVPLTGVGVDAAAKIEPERVDFGRIEVGRKKDLAIVFTNPSDLAIQVNAKPVGRDAGEFQIPSFPLAPFERKEVVATFAPTRVGVKDAAFEVEPCQGCPVKRIAIAAEGLEQAIVAEPPTLDFGRVPIDQESTLVVRLHNVSTEPGTLTAMALGAGTDASFTATAQAFPITLAPDQSYEFPVRYSPGHMGEANGQLQVSVDSARHPTTDVALKGFGGAAELCVSPLSYDFGLLPVGAKVSTMVTLRNCGADNGGPLVISDLSFADEPYIPGNKDFSVQRPPMPLTLLPGQEVQVKVFYEPTQEGNAGAFLEVRTTAYSGALVRIGFNGRARVRRPV